MLLEDPVEEFIRRAVLVQHQDWVADQLPKRECLVPELGKVFPGHKDVAELFDPDGGGSRSEIVVRVVYDNKIHLSVSQKLRTFHGRLVKHFDMGVWKRFVKPLQVWNEKVTAYRVAGADADLSSCGGGVEELGLPFLDQVHGRFDMAHKDLTFRSQLYFFRAADKKHLVQLAFQRFDGLAHGRLGDEKLLGCLGKIQCERHVVEDFVKFVIDIYH